jgi:hypothetical protein
MKVCNKCNIEKDFESFRKRNDSIDGYRKNCKECENNYFRQYNLRNKDSKKEYNRNYNILNKETIKIQKSKYKQENKEKIKQRNKKYYESNKEYIKERNKNYYHLNKNNDIPNRKWVNYKDSIYKKRKDRKNTNSLYKLTASIRTLISNSIRKNSYSKSEKTNKILGCSFEDFKIYIESLFKDNMSWDNYGDWHLDHKTPISWAETEEEIYELNHYTNFQPLWKYDNLSKGNRYSD